MARDKNRMWFTQLCSAFLMVSVFFAAHPACGLSLVEDGSAVATIVIPKPDDSVPHDKWWVLGTAVSYLKNYVKKATGAELKVVSEDQVLPKRCGHLSGKRLVPVEEMVGKIKAALDARQDPDFVVIARTDAIAVEGFEQALDRAAIYQEAGCDMLFVEAPRTTDQLAAISERFAVPTLYNMASSGKTPFLAGDEIAALGFKLVIYPNLLILAGISAAARALRELKSSGSIAGLMNEIASFTEFFDLVGMEEVQRLEERYGVPEDARARY